MHLHSKNKTHQQLIYCEILFLFQHVCWFANKKKTFFFVLIYISPDYQFLLRIFSLWFWELEKLKSTMLKINIKQISCWVLFERPWDVPTSPHIFDSYAPFHKINIWSIFYWATARPLSRSIIQKTTVNLVIKKVLSFFHKSQPEIGPTWRSVSVLQWRFFFCSNNKTEVLNFKMYDIK